MFADVSSANVVGYMNKVRPAEYQIFCGGACFVAPGSNSYTLADLKITGTGFDKKGTARLNFIQFFKTGDAARLDDDRAYYYRTGTYNKWFKLASSITGDEELADPSSVIINAGEGFFCNFATADATILYAGEVVKGNLDKKITITRPAGYQIFVTANPCGSAINLSQITINGTSFDKKGTARLNFVQFFKKGDAARLDDDRAYYYRTGTYNKWFKLASSITGDEELADPTSVVLQPGEGIFCNFASADAAITMPTSL